MPGGFTSPERVRFLLMRNDNTAVSHRGNAPHLAPQDSVSVEAPARLHMGFLNLAADGARRFGGLGLAISRYAVRLSVSKAEEFSAAGPDGPRAGRFAGQLLQGLDGRHGVHIEIERAIPEHAGLGSGTQLALAVGQGIARLLKLDWSIAAIAQRLGRGNRSGVGIGAFCHGGFLIDGGHLDEAGIPPVIARYPFPEQWRVLLVEDPRFRGLNGAHEVHAFQNLAPMTPSMSAELCRTMMLAVLPGLQEQDFTEFTTGLGRMQRLLGEYFAAEQGGNAYSSVTVGAAMDWLESQGIRGVGQSSWGPTGFAIIETATKAARLVDQIAENVPDSGQLRLSISRAQNVGAQILRQPAREQPSHTVS